MRCDDARLLLLEAEDEELEGRGDSALSVHLRSCPRCAAAAAEIVRATAELDAHLAAPVDEAAVDAVLARLAGAAPRSARGIRPARARRWRRSAWASLALAAAAAGIVFVTRGPAPSPGAAPRVAAAPELPLVESSGAATVAVIQTDNPDITVLWFF